MALRPVGAGGNWEETLTLSKAEVFSWMLLCAVKRQSEPSDRVDFSVMVDVRGDGHHKRVDLYSVCGPGDNAEPCITIMLVGED